MKIAKNKTLAIAITILLTFSMTASMMLLPIANAHTPPWTIEDRAYIAVAPNPIGVGQTLQITIWTAQPMPDSLIYNNIRKGPFTLIITEPDGTNVTSTWAYAPNSGGLLSTTFVPSVTGNYTATFKYGGQTYPTLSQVVSTVPLGPSDIATIDAFAGDTFSAATAVTTFTVQSTPLVGLLFPLPTSYWTRPIEGENFNWYTVASNWLGGNSGQFGSFNEVGYNIFQPFGTAPTSAHILWTKPLEFGGVVGGSDTTVPGATFYSGDSYEMRFTSPIIMDGYLYYKMPYSDMGDGTTVANGVTYGGAFVCVNLRTGQTVWTNTNPAFDPTWGELMNVVNPNQSGIIPSGYLWQAVTVGTASVNTEYGPAFFANVTWEAFDGFTGDPVFSITNIPQPWSVYAANGNLLETQQLVNSGLFLLVPNVGAYGPNGELLQYVLDYNTVTKTGWLALWNSTQLVENTYVAMSEWRPIGQSYDGTYGYMYAGNYISPYTWNVTIKADLDGLAANPTLASGVSLTGPTINAVIPGDVMFGTSSALYETIGTPTFLGISGQWTPNPFTMWAINLNASVGAIGQVLWVKNYTAPDVMATNPNLGSFTQRVVALDPTTGVVTMEIGETFEWLGYNVYTGNQLWGPTTTVFTDDYQYYGSGLGLGQNAVDAYGNIYVQGYGGEVWCYDTANGNLLWQWGNGGPGNSSNDGINSPWGLLPTLIDAVANGEVFVSSQQHGNGALSPYYKGEMQWCLNATTGKEIWGIYFQAPNNGGPGFPEGAIADGEYVNYNLYDNQLYAFGQGPSQTTVTAPDIGVTTATPVVIRGTVMDVSAGTKQTEQAGDFPNGVPCVSDASQSAWMEYVYMQKPEPTNVTGVPVTISVLDSNGNCYKIGTATTNAWGMYTLTWTPIIPGNYTVYATFAGTNSYYGSSATTSFYAGTPPPTAPPTAAPVTGLASTGTVELGVAVLAIVIIVCVAVLAVLMLRKHA